MLWPFRCGSLGSLLLKHESTFKKEMDFHLCNTDIMLTLDKRWVWVSSAQRFANRKVSFPWSFEDTNNKTKISEREKCFWFFVWIRKIGTCFFFILQIKFQLTCHFNKVTSDIEFNETNVKKQHSYKNFFQQKKTKRKQKIKLNSLKREEKVTKT